MAQKTSIEWVSTFHDDGTVTQGYTVNPIRFRPWNSEKLTTMCQKISPGCVNCYAASIVNRFWPKDSLVEFPGYTEQGLRSGKFELDMKQLLSVLKIKKPAKIFWGDMCDLFLEDISDHMLDMCFAVCCLTPHLTHMFLTKRPYRMLMYMSVPSEIRVHRIVQAIGLHFPLSTESKLQPIIWPLKNVLLGTSAENQKYFDERIGILDNIADLKWDTFLSLEPLIGPIDVEYPKSIYPDGAPMCCNGYDCGCRGLPVDPPMFWKAKLIITGGESGSKARPMLSEWAHDIRRACERWKKAYFHKQNGEWVDAGHEEFGKLPKGKIKALRSDGSEWKLSDMPEDSNADVHTVQHVGRKRAGKTLYSKTYHEFPDRGAK